MASVNLTLRARTPRWRIRIVRAAVFLCAPFVRKQATADRIEAAALSWIKRGIRISAEKSRGD